MESARTRPKTQLIDPLLHTRLAAKYRRRSGGYSTRNADFSLRLTSLWRRRVLFAWLSSQSHALTICRVILRRTDRPVLRR